MKHHLVPPQCPSFSFFFLDHEQDEAEDVRPSEGGRGESPEVGTAAAAAAAEEGDAAADTITGEDASNNLNLSKKERKVLSIMVAVIKWFVIHCE